MRIIGLHTLPGHNQYPATFWLNESVVSREGRPFYIPDWDNDFRLFPMLALRVSKVGKSIPARFAHRYIREASVWLHARGMNTLARLAEQGLPLASSIAFDGALSPGQFVDVQLDELPALNVTVTGDDSAHNFTLSAEARPAEIFEQLSARNTMRTGDIILLPLDGPELRPSRGSRLELLLNAPCSTPLLRLLIK